MVLESFQTLREGCREKVVTLKEGHKSLERSACRGGSLEKGVVTLREVYQERAEMLKMGVGAQEPRHKDHKRSFDH